MEVLPTSVVYEERERLGEAAPVSSCWSFAARDWGEQLRAAITAGYVNRPDSSFLKGNN